MDEGICGINNKKKKSIYLAVPVSASLEAVTRRGCILTVSNIGWKNRKQSPQFIKLQALCDNFRTMAIIKQNTLQ
jgi:hypothetical protein